MAECERCKQQTAHDFYEMKLTSKYLQVWIIFSRLESYTIRINTVKKTKVVTAVWGTNLIQILAALAIFDQDDMKKNVKRITATWWNGRFENG